MPVTDPTPPSGPRAPCDLVELGGRRPLRHDLTEVWQRRHFAWALARSEVRSKHLDSTLGQLWQVLNPAFMIGIYFVIFGVVLDARRGVEHYITFLVAGVIIFRFMQTTVTGCGHTLTRNLGLLRSIQFPRSVLPLSVGLEQLLALVPGLVLVLVVAAADGVRPGWELLALPCVIASAASLSLGWGFIVARTASTVPDITQLLPHVFRVLLYISGVLFSVDEMIDTEWVRSLFALNPFYCAITALRWSILGQPTSGTVALSLGLWSVVSLVVGALWFRAGEHRYGA
jgi:teichoic acid transport system permease protein